MKTAILYRKNVIYALHRRLTGRVRTKGDIQANEKYNPMSFNEACEDLVATYTAAGKSAPGISKLARDLLPPRELKPNEYEAHDDPPIAYRLRSRGGRGTGPANATAGGERGAGGASGSGDHARPNPPDTAAASAEGAHTVSMAAYAALQAELEATRAALAAAAAGRAYHAPGAAGAAAGADARSRGQAETGEDEGGALAPPPRAAEKELAGAAAAAGGRDPAPEEEAARVGTDAPGAGAAHLGAGRQRDSSGGQQPTPGARRPRTGTPDAAAPGADPAGREQAPRRNTPPAGYPAGLFGSPGVASPLRQRRRPNTPAHGPALGQRPPSRLMGVAAASGTQPAAQRGLFRAEVEPAGLGAADPPSLPPQVVWPHLLTGFLGASGNQAEGAQPALPPAGYAAALAAVAALLGGGFPAAGAPVGNRQSTGAQVHEPALHDPFAGAARAQAASSHGAQTPFAGPGAGGQASELADGRLQLGGALLSAPRVDELGQTTHVLLAMPPLAQLRAPRRGLGGNESRLATQAARLAALVGGVLLTLGAAAALATITQALMNVLRALTQRQMERLKTTLGGPMGDAFAKQVQEDVRAELTRLLAEITEYASGYDADVRTVAQKVSVFLGGTSLPEAVLKGLQPGRPGLSATQNNWLRGAGGLLREGVIFEKPMTAEMWREGFGPQLGCLQRIGDVLEAAERLLSKTHLAAAYNAGGSGEGRGSGGARAWQALVDSGVGKECAVTPCNYSHDNAEQLASRLAKVLEAEHARQQAGAK
ncbi:hypothetical protein PLESTM_000921300 [Pleodorina starrii]|nr:hypothetical protein PLESTM_000921300 [Pleodorina starrii]